MTWVYITVESILAETNKALLCVIDGEEVWLPLSQIEDGGKEYGAGMENVEFGITERLAKEKGLGGE